MAFRTEEAAPKLLASGNSAVVVEFGDRVDLALNARVLALEAAVHAAAEAGRFPGFKETAPTFRSLFVRFDPLKADRAEVDAAIGAALEAAQAADAAAQARERKVWRFPTAYGGENGPDLADVAARTGMSEERVVALHAGARHHVFMLGFLPGAPFLGGLPAEIDLPRRTEPRLKVPARSVALAVGLTVIYPVESPGGWNLLGKTAVRLFSPDDDPPALLTPGDLIRFTPTPAEEVASLSQRASEGAWRPDFELEPAEASA